ncbi:hypothetical protein [Fibrivirga algicola]|uniref:Uncharacterized protein n=1 Tax=Fibrivirga algicola TaxID=2950420 RepID=A0ABX0QSQ9_9BACT|nr:hypothetical protein [Fibrivirga algicola]NID13798.1 hypothetical protein [Fibrivirga algicola]
MNLKPGDLVMATNLPAGELLVLLALDDYGMDTTHAFSAVVIIHTNPSDLFDPSKETGNISAWQTADFRLTTWSELVPLLSATL